MNHTDTETLFLAFALLAVLAAGCALAAYLADRYPSAACVACDRRPVEHTGQLCTPCFRAVYLGAEPPADMRDLPYRRGGRRG